MIDRRNTYRIRYRNGTYGVRWYSEYRPWWSPFWSTINDYEVERRARERCDEHAAEWQRRRDLKIETKIIGRLPNE